MFGQSIVLRRLVFSIRLERSSLDKVSLALVFSDIFLNTDFLEDYLIKLMPFLMVFSLLCCVLSVEVVGFCFLKQKTLDFFCYLSMNCWNCFKFCSGKKPLIADY